MCDLIITNNSCNSDYYGPPLAILNATIVIDHETIGPSFIKIQEQYNVPVTITQDLTTFNITKESIITRQASVNLVA